MKLLALLKDLIHTLPTTVSTSWTQVEHLRSDRPTVVLVSGFGATRRNLSAFRRRLERDGYNVLILALDWATLSDSVQGFYRLAHTLAGTLIALRKRPDLKANRVYIIAHSAGGLVARYYVQQLGGYHYCHGLITLGTPHQGTWAPLWGLLTHLVLKARCLFQMLPTSRLIRRVNEFPFPATTCPYLSISSKSDLLCHPRIAKIPMLWEELVDALELDGFTHGELLTSKVVYGVCTDFLRRENSAADSADKATIGGRVE